MKKLRYLALALFSMTTFLSCSDLLDVNSEKYLVTEDNLLTSPNDSVYSLFGILADFQELSEEYVVMGEVRADLVDVTEYSDNYLRELSNHSTLSKENPYISVTPFYKVINDCNYVITKMDTMVGNKALHPDYAAAVKIRAWTYFQLSKNFSSVRYTDQPILTVQDAKDLSKCPLVTREALLDLLIPQLLTVESVPSPGRFINSISLNKMIPSSEFLLAEIYLWQGEYAKAATYYKKMMEKDYGYVCDNTFDNRYSATGVSLSWFAIISNSYFSYSNEYEVTCGIYCHSKYGYMNKLVDLTWSTKPSLKASSSIVDFWRAQAIDGSTSEEMLKAGDARGLDVNGSYGSWIKNEVNTLNGVLTYPLIAKFRSDTAAGPRTIIERGAYFNLRYAEAVNRLGKPTLALAALNKGLKRTVLKDTTQVDPKELLGDFPYLNFDKVLYDGSLGVRGRAGLKPITFPKDMTDSIKRIEFVEDAIINEAALETAFEGNRWTDLVRVAIRRFDTDPNYLADKVTQKFKPNPLSYIPFVPSADKQTVWNNLMGNSKFFLTFPE